ncbi:hypothetical protein PIB30_034966 [Stylosanthes scabra]|uniref:Uncharacterized protein n=1 Tax=Stylosanthes scabra TaxID=79078 RepID=A0ABU6ZCC6_9FABA|nr:hypothetical protein [Stylosanthes scabra]
MAVIFPGDRAARTELAADRCDRDGGMHSGKEGKRLPSIALSPTAMLRGAPRAMNQERDDYGYGYDYCGGNIWGIEEEQRLGGGKLLQEVPSNFLEILGWGRDMAIRVGTTDFIRYGSRSKTSEGETQSSTTESLNG